MQKRIRRFRNEAMDSLVNADWPGNIRELANFIERCVIFTEGHELRVPIAELNALIRAFLRQPPHSNRQTQRDRRCAKAVSGQISAEEAPPNSWA